jgi:hypothetical protein
MIQPKVVVGGTLKPDGTLELDEKPTLPAGRVQVTLMREAPAEAPKEDVLTVLERIWKEREARGMKGRSKEEIDAEVSAMRREMDERQEEIERLQEEAGRSREDRAC